MVHAEEPPGSCPPIQPQKNLRAALQSQKPASDLSQDDQQIQVSADRVHSAIKGLSVFTGNVELRRGSVSIYGDEIIYDQKANRIEGAGNISMATEAGDTVYAPQLHYELDSESGYTGRSLFALAGGAGRGDAERITFSKGSVLVMDNMHYTACPPGQDDWVLRGKRLTLDRENQIGTVRNVSVRFMHVPIFYTPYFSFPLGEERKTGVLVPNFGHSDKRGYFLAVPYYINLAPNYDDTLTPRYMSRRGLQLQNEFRYMGGGYGGKIDLEYLPNDTVTDTYRAAGKYRHGQTFSDHWGGDMDMQWISDKDYLVDLGDSIAATSATHLPRSGQLAYNDNIWRFTARTSSYQTVDESIDVLFRPYSLLPQFILAADVPTGTNRLHYALSSEWVNFDRNAGVTGQRLDINPSVSLPLRNSYAFVIPKAGYRYTAYNLTGTTLETPDETPERRLPIYSLDSGLLFEREGEWSGHDYIQTLEPRLFYLAIPYENQDGLPNFDTGIPDFSFYNLFRENRFVGADRVGDADQATVAISTRFLDASNGVEQVRFSLGQTFYFQNPQLILPSSKPVDASSNMVAEIQARLGQYWYVRGALQWDSKEYATERSNILLQYRPARNKIINLGYRYNKSIQEQADVSIQWPLSARWALLSRWNYALPEKRTLQSYTGFEYTDCCWAFRITKGQRILADGNVDNPILFELELSGLAKLGPRPESPLNAGRFIFE
jgi:LPS-assembly protein